MKITKIDNLIDAINYHNAIINSKEEIIVLDFSEATFIRNNFISIIGLALEIQKDKKITIIEPKNNQIRDSLRNIGFLPKYTNCAKGIDINNTMIQYTNIKKEDEEYYQFYEYFINQLKRKVSNLSDELKYKIMQKIGEQFSNVFRHSKSELGFFCSGQFYPSKKEFNFTIVDNGVTIKKNVNDYFRKLVKENKGMLNFKKYKELNGLETIKWALKNNNSTTGSGGFGLSLLNELIIKSKGRLEIVSNDGYYKIINGEDNSSMLKINNTIINFNGTIISICLNTDDSRYYYLKGEKKDD